MRNSSIRPQTWNHVFERDMAEVNMNLKVSDHPIRSCRSTVINVLGVYIAQTTSIICDGVRVCQLQQSITVVYDLSLYKLNSFARIWKPFTFVFDCLFSVANPEGI